jgi:hypothetical protein
MILDKKGLIGYQVTMPLFIFYFLFYFIFQITLFFYLILISSFFVAWTIIAVMVGSVNWKNVSLTPNFFFFIMN